MNQLSINSLYCQYDSQSVIENLSLELIENEIIALLGPSGCGKTTLLKAIAGLQPVTSGDILISQKQVNGKNISVPSEKRNIGMIFQDYALFPHLTAAENVAFGLSKIDKESQMKRVNEMLNLVGLAEFSNRYPNELSGGQQQRVAIARALAYHPELILLDEPFSNIDNKSRELLLPEIRRILKNQNVSGLLVTHSKDEAFAFADKIAVFQNGQIAQLGTAEELYYRPNSKYVADFIGKASFLPVLTVLDQSVETPFGIIECHDINTENALEAEIMLRPEQISIAQSSSSNFQITNKTFCGHYWQYEVTASKGKHSLLTYSNENFAENESVRVEIAPLQPIFVA